MRNLIPIAAVLIAFVIVASAKPREVTKEVPGPERIVTVADADLQTKYDSLLVRFEAQAKELSELQKARQTTEALPQEACAIKAEQAAVPSAVPVESYQRRRLFGRRR